MYHKKMGFFNIIFLHLLLISILECSGFFVGLIFVKLYTYSFALGLV